jgi:hypothetical protein
MGDAFPISTLSRRLAHISGTAPAYEGQPSGAMSAQHESDQLAGIRVPVVEGHDDSRDVLEQVLAHVAPLSALKQRDDLRRVSVGELGGIQIHLQRRIAASTVWQQLGRL